MDSIAHALSDSSSEEEFNVPRRILRDRANVLELPNERFISLFRLSKEAFLYVFKEIEDKLSQPKNSWGIRPIVKLSAVLGFMADGAYQQGTGQDVLISMSQPAISKNLWHILSILQDTLCPKWIKFEMNENEERLNKRIFFDISKIPGVTMCIDGTHIRIIKPKESEHLHFNRKGYHSINAMIICDSKMFIRAINARYGGASHDSLIWTESNERRHTLDLFNEGKMGTYILGDSGYPLEPWLLTPFRNAERSQRKDIFNTAHSKARCIVERTIGVLKQRFRCILGERELHYNDPKKISLVINVACALHNICCHYNVTSPEIPTCTNVIPSDSNVAATSEDSRQLQSLAKRIRNEISESLCR